MKALSYERFGGADQMQFTEQPEPIAAKGQVVVAVAARSINVIDIRVRNGAMGPLVNNRFPKIPGCDLAGTVTQVGPGVRGLAVGDRVFGATAPFVGGSFAERVVVDASQLAPVPDGVAMATAAALPIAGLAALYALRDLGRLAFGQRLLVHGATGAVGLYAIQLAKIIGATVTAVGGAGLQSAASFGADVLIDYRTGEGMRFDMPFDLILNASGRLPWTLGRHHLALSGRLVEPSPSIPLFIGALAANPFRRRKHLPLATTPRRADIEYLGRLVVDRRLEATIAGEFPFGRAKDAFEVMERGGVVGKIVVTA